MASSPLLIVWFFSPKINKVQANDEINSVTKIRPKCRLYHVNKKKTNGQTEGRTNGRRKPRHDISSAGFQSVKLKIKALSLPVSEKNFEVGLPSSYVPTCGPRGGASFDPRGIIWTNLVAVHKEMLYTKYESSRPSSLREQEFWILPSLFLCSNLWPMSITWTSSEVHKKMLHTKYQSSTPSSFREEEFWRWASLFLYSNLWPPGQG